MSDDGWIPVLPDTDLPQGKSTRVDAGGVPVMLYRGDDELFAIGNRCSHQGAPLDRGPVKIGGSEATVTCQAHGSMFRLRDGSVARGPAMAPVPAFEVRITDGTIELKPRA